MQTLQDGEHLYVENQLSTSIDRFDIIVLSLQKIMMIIMLNE